MRRVVALVLPQVVAFDLAVPAQVFGHADEQERYSFELCATESGLVPSTTGFDVSVASGRATTHWRDAAELAARHPDVTVVPDVLYVAAGLAATCTWALERLGEPLAVKDLAQHSGWAPRTFARRFVAETGTTPQRWLTAQSLGTSANLRRHFTHDCGVPPDTYRRMYRRKEHHGDRHG